MVSFILISEPLFFKATLAWILFLKPGTAPKGTFTMRFCDHLQCVLSSASESRAHVWWCDCCSAGVCPNWVIFLWAQKSGKAEPLLCSFPAQSELWISPKIQIAPIWAQGSKIWDHLYCSCFVMLPYFWNHTWSWKFLFPLSKKRVCLNSSLKYMPILISII